MKDRKSLFSCALLAITASGMLMATGPSFAANTEWLTSRQLNGVISTWGGGKNGPPPKFYPTAVACKDDGKGPRFRMTYTPIAGSKPFYRWNWVHAKTDHLGKAVEKLKRSDRLELKYRVVQQNSYEAKNGTSWTCAIAYR